MAWKFGQPVRFETDRLIIRTLVPADVSARMVAWFADVEVMRYMAMAMNLGAERLKAMLERAPREGSLWLGFWWKETGQMIGFSKLGFDFADGNVTTTTMIGEPTFWGKGVGTEARAAIIEFLFADAGARKIFTGTYVVNERSTALDEKLGFRLEATLRQHERGRYGEWLNINLLGLFPEEWKQGLGRKQWIRGRGSASAANPAPAGKAQGR